MENEISKYNIDLATKMGRIEEGLENLHEKIDMFFKTHEKSNDKIWIQLEKHSDKINFHNSFIKWVIGLGAGGSAVLSIIFTILK